MRKSHRLLFLLKKKKNCCICKKCCEPATSWCNCSNLAYENWKSISRGYDDRSQLEGRWIEKNKQSEFLVHVPDPQSTTTAETHATEISASSRDTQPSTPRRTSRVLTAMLMGFFCRSAISSENDNTNHIFVSHYEHANGCYPTDH